MAAIAAMVGSEATAAIIAARFGSLTISITTVSAVRMPGSTVADANALRRNTAEQINSRADAATCRPIRIARALPGLASLINSPRIVRAGSMRVACSAGINPKNAVEITPPAIRNTATRQSAGGAAMLMLPISGGMLGSSAASVPSIAIA